MKHNTRKKTLSLLLVIGMMGCLAGCVSGEENLTEPAFTVALVVIRFR